MTYTRVLILFVDSSFEPVLFLIAIKYRTYFTERRLMNLSLSSLRENWPRDVYDGLT